MNRKQRIDSWFRGWILKEPIMSEGEKAYKRKVASVFLGVAGVLFGWGAAGYAYIAFTLIGVAPYYATIYSALVSISVVAIIWLIAINLKKIQQYFTKELKA
jgi:hypothetical protein